MTLPAAPPRMFDNPTLFGHDPMPGIVAVDPVKGSGIQLWRRLDGRLQHQVLPFHPYIWVADASLLEGGPVPVEVRQLEGGGALRVLAFFEDWDALQLARRHLSKTTGESAGSPDAPYRLITDAVQQYLSLSGRTLFKELKFTDLVRVQIAIDRDGDEIASILVNDAELRADSEKALLEALDAEIVRLDPDVIEGHEIFRQLEAVRARAAKYKLKLKWGRDGSLATSRVSRLQFAERTIDYPRFEAAGRHVLDTWLLAHYYDISHRSLASFSLRDVAEHFSLAAGPETRQVRALSDLLAPIYFLQAQIFPYGFQNVMVRGNATRIDALFIREYMRRGHALPQMAADAPTYEGGYADMFETGVLGPVAHVDVQSLYPSLMLVHEICPPTDELKIFLDLLRDLRDFRVEAKALARGSQHPEERAYYDALQSTFKILINSFYGYLGTSFCHFANNAAAAEVTRQGRALITQMVEWLRARGCRPVEIDTDGVYFLPCGSDPNDILEGLGSVLPAGLNLELSGVYPAMLSYKVKNYALLDESGQVTIKGSGLKSRGIEKYLRDFLEDMIKLVLLGRSDEIEAMLESRLRDIAERRVDVRSLCKTETLTESVESYKQKVAAKKRNAAAVYELAAAAGKGWRAGDTFSYYVAGDLAARKVKVYEASRPLDAWRADAPDENVDYYQHKLRELAKKFEHLRNIKPAHDDSLSAEVGTIAEGARRLENHPGDKDDEEPGEVEKP